MPSDARPSLTSIALAFASISATSFGGGQKASIRQQVLARGWMEGRRFPRRIGDRPVLPGPNLLNLAIYCGQKVRGVPGAIAAFFGASVPPFVIVLIAGALYFKYAANPFVAGALRGSAAGALGLTIGNALELTWDERKELVRDRAGCDHRGRRLAAAHAAAARARALRGRRRRFGDAAKPAREPVADTFHSLLQLLWVFAQLSVLGFGGGKGIIPQMHTEAVGTYHWVSSQQFTEFYTIGKLVPGPTTIFAALIGYTATPFAPAAGRGRRYHAGMFVPSSLIIDRVRRGVAALRRVAVARHHLARPRAGDRRARLVERHDDRPRRAVDGRRVRRPRR